MGANPLITVAVVTYNSAKYILETLESIKAQTYNNIELIISDDKSTDNTVEICTKWLEENEKRFVNVKVIIPPKNTGQAGNMNRVLDSSIGEWVKPIAGDDQLLPNCVSDFMEYVKKESEAKILFGKIELFDGTKQKQKDFEQIFDYSFFKLSIKEQLEHLIYNGNCIPAASYIYNRKFIIEKNIRNDERIPFLEDYPKWINMLQKGIRFFFLDKPVARYRVGEGISTVNDLSDRYYHCLCMLDILYRYPVIAKDNSVTVEELIADRFVDMRRENKRVLKSKTYSVGYFFMFPLRWIRKRYEQL